MPPPVPGTVVGANAQVGPGGDTGSTAATPVADATQDGLLRRVSGLATDYVGGDNACHPRGATVVGNVAGDTVPPSAIVVPRYKNHPDAIWTPMSSLDDHFDAATIDPKWSLANTAGILNMVQEQAGSCFSQGGISPTSDGLNYAVYALGNLPNNNSFTLTVGVDVTALANWGTSGSLAWAWFRLQTAGSAGTEIRFGTTFLTFATTPVVNSAIHAIWGYSGTNFASNTYLMVLATFPRYWRFVYDNSTKITAIWISHNGFSFAYITSVAAAASTFNTAPPTRVGLGFTGINIGRGLVSFDWIRFTNP
jgi:hypothetical protein